MIHPLFKWFGTKWGASKHYPPPDGRPIFEPFAGSAGYSLRHDEGRVTIWESNPLLLDLWRWIISQSTEDLVREIPLDLPFGTDIRTLGLTHGQELLLKHWQRTNNYGNCWTISPWGNKPGQWTANTRARVSEEIQAVKHWKLTPPSFFEMGLHFIDPPYQYNYQYGVVNFDYAELKMLVNHIPQGSRIIACEAVCPKTGRVPDYFPFVPSHSQVTSRRKKEENHHSKELIWTEDR